MNIIIVSIHVAAAIILVLTVLLQAGKGSGMGAAFGGASGTVFGTRGPATLISKLTCAAAVIFMITSLNLALSQSGGIRKGSVMDSYSYQDAPMAKPAPSASAPQPAVSTTTDGEEGTSEASGAAPMAEAPAKVETSGASTETAPAATDEETQVNETFVPAGQASEE